MIDFFIDCFRKNLEPPIGFGFVFERKFVLKTKRKR